MRNIFHFVVAGLYQLVIKNALDQAFIATVYRLTHSNTQCIILNLVNKLAETASGRAALPFFGGHVVVPDNLQVIKPRRMLSSGLKPPTPKLAIAHKNLLKTSLYCPNLPS